MNPSSRSSPPKPSHLKRSRSSNTDTPRRPPSRYVHPGSSFGDQSPKITIGSKFPDRRPPPETPSPITYNPPPHPIDHRLQISFPRGNSELSSRNPTSTIEFINVPFFPEPKSFVIGLRNQTGVFRTNDIPGPSYLPSVTLSPRTHQISPRRAPLRPDSVPGPGAYDPKMTNQSQTSRLAANCGKRDRWLTVGESPGPGEYDPEFEFARFGTPSFTIGRKSRLRKKTERDIKFAIDVAIVNIEDRSLNREEVMNYLRTHGEIRKLVGEALKRILEEKPAEPLNLLREYFEKLPKNRNHRRHKLV
jgi:hypothetical protein